jgi:hypothetical protein
LIHFGFERINNNVEDTINIWLNAPAKTSDRLSRARPHPARRRKSRTAITREERVMKISSDHVLTTHTGSLPRPQQLIDLVYRKQEGKTVDGAAFDSMVGKTVDELVRRQVDIGVDVVSDGEVSKPGFVNYIAKRLAGFAGVGAPWALGDMDDLPELVMEQYGGAAGQHILMPECVGPVSFVGQDEVRHDIAHLQHAVGQSPVADAFIPATSPGCVTMCASNKHYPSYEDYLWAVADAMAEEYRAIVEAGFVLQLDCPDIPMIAHTRGWQDGKKIYGVWKENLRREGTCRVAHTGHQSRHQRTAARHDSPAHVLGQLFRAASSRRSAERNSRARARRQCRRLFVRGRESATRA